MRCIAIFDREVDKPTVVICPNCGPLTDGGFQIYQTANLYWDLKRVEDGRLVFHNTYESGDPHGIESLCCNGCGYDCPIPKDVQIEYE